MIENNQKPMAQNLSDSGHLNIHSHFLTIQGEGPFCGQRALFIRLHGCNLQCPGCDTDYTSEKLFVTEPWMVNKAREFLPVGGLVVITGGEPFRQNIVPSVRRLLEAGFRVQIETNGVLWLGEDLENLLFLYGGVGRDYPSRSDDLGLTIVCSPKTSQIHARVLAYAVAFKYVLQHGKVDEDGLPLQALRHKASPRVARPRPGAPVYVQPMDEADPAANALNLATAIRSVMDHGHTLQIQVHKIINME